MRLLITVVLFFALSLGALAQQMYRWIDASGRVHYTQTPPPADARGVQTKRLQAGSGDGVQLPYATRVASENFPVTLYVSPDCGAACKDAQAYLLKRGVPHRIVEVNDAAAVENLKKISGSNAVPVLMVGKAAEKGFEASQYQAALDAAGYPATGVPVKPEVQRSKAEGESAK